MIIRKAMYGCGLNFFIKLAYNSLFLYKFAMSNSSIWRYREDIEHNNMKKISK